MQKTKQKEFT